MTMKDVLIAVETELSLNELRALNKAVVERIRRLSSLKRLEFAVGQRVFWVSRTGVKTYGRVQKINPKNVRVQGEKGGLWTISPSLLSPADLGASKSAEFDIRAA